MPSPTQPATNSPVLLIQCPDEKGLVHKITGVLFRHGLNIVTNAEYVDAERGLFFMRTECEGDFTQSAVLAELRAELPPSASVRWTRLERKRIILMATKEPFCLGDLLLRQSHGELNAEILCVISNHEHLRPLVDRFGLPFFHVPSEGCSREAHEAEVRRVVDRFVPEFIVLAKYMRILTPVFVNAYPSRVINIHHSFLPAFAGAHPYRQAYSRGVKIIGATAHFVTENLDEGPIIAQSVIPVNHSQTVAEMTRAGRDIERLVLAEALRLVLQERVFICGNRTIIFD